MKQRMKAYCQCSLGLARAALVLLLVSVLVLILSLRATVARADDALMDLGRHLMTLSESGLGTDSRAVLINGQSLGFRVFTTEQEISTTLDFYEAWCRGGAGSFQAQEDRLAALDESVLLGAGASDRSWRDLTRREEEEGMGFVACIKHGIPNAGAEELKERWFAFLESGMLAELGQFHYAALKRIGGQTRVVAVWTQGKFEPMGMFPPTGDAPGFAPSGISRPPSGRRMLSAGEAGNAQTLTIYIECEESVSELASFYHRDFARRGWQLLGKQSPAPGQELFVVQRSGEMRIVSLIDESGAGTSVTVATSR